MQTLFEWDFNSRTDFDIEHSLLRNMAEFAPGLEDGEFVKNLVFGVVKNREKIDAIIEKTAPEWPILQIALVDRNVLRLGLFELMYGNRHEVPPKVAINESIELAKTFGGESSGKFVNGVLGTVYRELGEPGKDEGKKPQLDLTKIPLEKLAGAVVFRRDGDQLFFAMVHDVFGYWTLSKGRLEGDEEIKAGAKREIKEEINLDIEILNELGQNQYVASHPEKGPILKNVTYFLAEAKGGDLKLTSGSGGLDDARWFKLRELDDLKIYDDIRPLLEKSAKALLPK